MICLAFRQASSSTLHHTEFWAGAPLDGCPSPALGRGGCGGSASWAWGQRLGWLRTRACWCPACSLFCQTEVTLSHYGCASRPESDGTHVRLREGKLSQRLAWEHQPRWPPTEPSSMPHMGEEQLMLSSGSLA